MFYFLFVFIFLIIFLVVKNKSSIHTLLLILFLCSYFVLVCSTMIYLSKDAYYDNIISTYFSLPKKLWVWMIFLKIDRMVLLRTLNWSSVGVIAASVAFALSYYRRVRPKFSRAAQIGTIIYCLLTGIMFEPSLSIKLYYHLYPDYLSAAEFISIQQTIQQVVSVTNIILLILCMVLLIVSYLRMPRIRLVRRNVFCIIVCYCMISISYMAIFTFVPGFFLKISKISNSYTFRSIPLRDDALLYNIFPYYLIISFILITYSVYQIAAFQSNVTNKNMVMTRQIDASETTSKAFCHFVKNEVVAIQAAVEILPVEEAVQADIDDVVARCEELYRKLDELHQSTKYSKLELEKRSLQHVIEQAMLPFLGELKEYEVEYCFPEQQVFALLDEKYFSQALHNIIRNSIDAMQDLGQDRHKLILSIETMDHWIVLQVEDFGSGIAQNNLDKIFNPFFSSKPTSKSWGMGLSLTYKIITAHDGQIEVESTRGKGTVMRIMLPNMKKIMV